MSRWRSLLLLLSILVLAFVAGELALRLYFALVPDPPGSRYVREPFSHYRLRPGPFWEDGRAPEDIVNSFGFRDREHPIEKPEGTYRIVGIGDSFVLGAVPIEDNFLRVAERSLNESFGGDSLAFEIARMGLGGYGPENELGVLRSTALSLQPDLVILCFFVGNDVTGIPLRGEVLGGELYFVRSSNTWHNLLRRSRLFVLAEKVLVTRWRLRNLRNQKARAADAMDAETSPGGGERDFRPSLYYLLIQKKRLPVYARDRTREIEPLWAKAEEILVEFDRLCREASLPWLLVLIPAEEQIDREVRRKVLEALSIEEGLLDFDLPQRRLRAFAAEQRIEVLDLLPVFRSQEGEGKRLYIPNDTHWNAAGNALAGREIAGYVEQLLRERDP